MAHPAVHLHAGAHTMSPQARRSLRLLWWIPLSPIVGFLVASVLLSDSWPLWQVLPLASALAAPFVVGALDASAAVRRHDRTGWLPLVLHVAMTIVAIAVPVSESIGR